MNKTKTQPQTRVQKISQHKKRRHHRGGNSKFSNPVFFKPTKLPALPQHRRNLQHRHPLRHLRNRVEQQTLN